MAELFKHNGPKQTPYRPLFIYLGISTESWVLAAVAAIAAVEPSS